MQIPISSQLHRTSGEIYLRSDDGDYKIKGTHQIASVVNRKLGLFTEQKVIKNLTIDDLQPDLFDKARILMRTNKRNHPWNLLTNKELLKIAGFYTTDQISGESGLILAAILFFGSDELIRQILPAYKFDCLLRKEKIDRYDDRMIIQTNLIDAYDQMMAFVEKHLNDPFYLEGDLRVSL